MTYNASICYFTVKGDLLKNQALAYFFSLDLSSCKKDKTLIIPKGPKDSR